MEERMGLYTGTVRNLRHAPYRDQVLVHLISLGTGSLDLTDAEEAKIRRVRRFLHAEDCAREIVAARAKVPA